MAVKIGDLFHDGHNYYQAVAVTAKTVTVRQIKSKCVRHGDTRTAFDYDLVMKPLRNEFTDCVFFSMTWSTVVTKRETVFVLFLFMSLFCWLLVCEVPMFAFKGRLTWQKEKAKIIFVVLADLILILSALLCDEGIWIGLSRGAAVSIGLYVVTSMVASFLPKNEE